MPRIVKDPDERRAELVTTAQALFFTNGYESTSVSDIVKAVGVAQGTFYYYFDSKPAILEAMIADLTAEMVAQFRNIASDGHLNALQKWTRAVQEIGGWKVERKSELLAFARVLLREENTLLRYKLVMHRQQLLSPILAEIVKQGVEEGVFNTDYPAEAAEIAYTAVNAYAAKLTDIVIHPDRYDKPAVFLQRKYRALISAVERILGAEPGSMWVYGDSMDAWFHDRG